MVNGMTYRYEILKEKLQERQGAIAQDLDNIEQAIKRLNKSITLMEVEQAMLLQEQFEIRELLEEWNG